MELLRKQNDSHAWYTFNFLMHTDARKFTARRSGENMSHLWWKWNRELLICVHVNAFTLLVKLLLKALQLAEGKNSWNEEDYNVSYAHDRADISSNSFHASRAVYEDLSFVFKTYLHFILTIKMTTLISITKIPNEARLQLIKCPSCGLQLLNLTVAFK